MGIMGLKGVDEWCLKVLKQSAELVMDPSKTCSKEDYETLNQENISGDGMLRRDLRNSKRQSIQDLWNARTEGVRGKSWEQHPTWELCFFKCPMLPNIKNKYFKKKKPQIFHQYWWTTNSPLKIWLSTKNNLHPQVSLHLNLSNRTVNNNYNHVRALVTS